MNNKSLTLERQVITPSQILLEIKEFRNRSLSIGVALFALNFAFYCFSFIGIIYNNTWEWKLIFSLLNGICIATLFIIGHDASHGSLTPNKKINQIIGRIALLPSLHPYSMWILGHNKIHHSWTNLQGIDYVWTPLSKKEFDELPSYRKILERIYRTPGFNLVGVGIYYFVELWGKHMILPRKSEWSQLNSWISKIDYLLVIFFALLQISLITYTSDEFILLNIFFGLILPFALWNWQSGLVVYLQHTHPQVVWFKDKQKWSYFDAQVKGTTHTIFPFFINNILHNILEHTAHHSDTRIPLYNLSQAQQKLEDKYPEDIIQQKFSVSTFIRIGSICQLYDYENSCWLDFNGNKKNTQ